MMSKVWRIAALGLALAVAVRVGAAQESESMVRLVHDEDAREFVVLIGPIDLPAGAMVADEAANPNRQESQGDHGGHGGHGAVFPPVTELRVPTSGYLYGFSYEVLDRDGAPLPTDFVHHFNLINPDNRELFLPISQRMLAVGKETGDQSMPWLLMGYPVAEGMRMVVSAMLHNPTAVDQPGVTVRVALKYVRPGRPWPLANVYPFQLDVGFPAGDKAFDLPPGESTFAYEASPAMAGRIMVIGGHLHEYATGITFEDVTENEVIWEGRALTDEGEKVVGVTIGHLYRTLGARIKPDHVYRVSVMYHNPFADTLRSGGMGLVAGVFMPGESMMWPRVDVADELYQLDRAHYLREVRGRYEEIMAMEPGAAPAEPAGHQHD
jgi:hypothetical protein